MPASRKDSERIATLAARGVRWCNQCKQELPLSSFGKNGRYRGAKINSECRACNARRSREYQRTHKEQCAATNRLYLAKNKEVLKKQRQEKLAADPGLAKRNKLKYVYRISEHRYQELLDSQNGVCAICKKPETRIAKGSLCQLSVDHDHSCCPGKKSCGSDTCIRGLLCTKCNTALGLLDESIENIDSLRAYLCSKRGKQSDRQPYVGIAD
jgi:hypothetical protein